MRRFKVIAFFFFVLIFIRSYSQNINKHNVIGPAGLQVNSYTGSLFYQRNDLHIPGRGLSIDLTFFYNSSTTSSDLGYGPGWSMTFAMICKKDSNKVIVSHSDGRKDAFTSIGNLYNAPSGIFDSLVQHQSGKFKLFSASGVIYFFEDSIHHRLTKVSDMNNNSIIIGYTDSLATTITDASGRIVTLTYTNSHLTQITDLNFNPARTISYLYDPLNNPITVTDAIGNSIQYEYDVLHNMNKLYDQLSNLFTISYQNCINVANITSPLNSVNLSYDNALLTTTVSTTVNGSQQISSYRYDSNGDLVEKTGSCCGYHQLYVYDAMHNLIKMTDANGNIYLLDYDFKGNLLKETDPLGNVFVKVKGGGYAANPVRYTLTSTTDKNGNTINYTYDANGNLLQINKPLGINESYTYDIVGNVISHTDGRGNTTNYQYNANGDLTHVIFPGGATHSYSYDNVSNRTAFTDANGNTTNYTFDKLNRITQITNALGNVSLFTYDSRGSLISESDFLGHNTTYAYNALYRMTALTDPAGTITAVYDENGNALSVTDRRGNIMNYSYDLRNLLITETDPLGFTKSYTYDANGNNTSVINKRGFNTTYSYDALNRLTGVINALNQTTAFGYDANSNATIFTDANGHVTTYVYDALNRQTQTIRPVGTKTYTYDAGNNQIAFANANGSATTYLYDTRNRLIQTTDALGQNSTFNYDAQGNLISTSDRLGHLSLYTYDSRNRNITRVNPLGETETFVYDAAGRITSITLATGNTITYSYDAADRLLSESDIVGILSTYTYDANSNLLTITDANGHINSHIYDVMNRVTNIFDPLGNSTNYGYNPEGSLISFTDRNGNITNYQIDALERISLVINPSGSSISTNYDPVSNIISKSDNNANPTTYVYDVNDRLITEASANGSSKNYSYDLVGNLISRTDNNGSITNYVYDALNRLAFRNYPGLNDDVFVYDNESRLTSANNTNAAVAFAFDNADRMLSENLNGKTTAYSYDIPNRKTSITYPDGRNINEEYDLRLRISFVTEGGPNPASVVVNFVYDAADRILSRSNNNGVVTNYSYDNNDRITGLNHIKTLSILGQFNYTFDNEYNILSVQKNHHPANSEKYSFDSDYRLTEFNEGTLTGGNIPVPVTQTKFNYDGAGNRIKIVHDALTTTYLINNVNEYTEISEDIDITPTYDLNGNVLNDGLHSYSYDYENRLLSVDGGATAIYKYDALGRRIQKNSSSETINYFYANQQVIEERDALDAVKATYVYGTWVDDVLSMRRAGADYFYHQNAIGSVVAVTDNLGSVVERYEYDAYGKTSIFSGLYVPRNATLINNNKLFTGRDYDAETDNYHYRARSYNPDWGRFNQRDPIGNWTDGLNLGNHYGYVGNNPVNWIDPAGLSPISGPHRPSGPSKGPVPNPQSTPKPSPDADTKEKSSSGNIAKKAIRPDGAPEGETLEDRLKRQEELEKEQKKIKERQEELERELKKLKEQEERIKEEIKGDQPNKGAQVGNPHPHPTGGILKREIEKPKSPVVTSDGPKLPIKQQPPTDPRGGQREREDPRPVQPQPASHPQEGIKNNPGAGAVRECPKKEQAGIEKR